jgi:microcompartment protein CcmL/EutN
MEKRSLGLIETWGYVPAIEAADAGTKAADVVLLGYEEVRAGLITVKFVGDVAAIQAAVAAGAAAGQKVGKVVAVHVIPRPDRQLRISPVSSPPPTPAEEEEAPPPAEKKKLEEVAEPSAPVKKEKPKKAKARPKKRKKT